MRSIILIAHDIRSCHNVGALLRTAEGLGVAMVYLTGYTPYPSQPNDDRLPHIHQKLTKQIHKTALGAEITQRWTHADNVSDVLYALKEDGYMIAALEQTEDSTKLPLFEPPQKIALLLGREVDGIDADFLKETNITLEIPMFGSKESFNVVHAAAIALYHLRFNSL